jgi:hypothetical protein
MPPKLSKAQSPATCPIEQASKLKQHGIAVPPNVLTLADEVIE